MVNRNADITGMQFGRLTAMSSQGVINGRSMWLCKCNCGNEKVVRRDFLISGGTQSCGCIKKEVNGNRARQAIKHGQYQTATYVTWEAMRQRCNNPKSPGYPDYGGRGISICERWDDFVNFLADMGERPEGKTIDRIDVNGNYEPTNCRWSTPKEQSGNRRITRKVKYGEGEITLRDLAKSSGVAYTTLQYRLKHGLDLV